MFVKCAWPEFCSSLGWLRWYAEITHGKPIFSRKITNDNCFCLSKKYTKIRITYRYQPVDESTGLFAKGSIAVPRRDRIRAHDESGKAQQRLTHAHRCSNKSRASSRREEGPQQHEEWSCGGVYHLPGHLRRTQEANIQQAMTREQVSDYQPLPASRRWSRTFNGSKHGSPSRPRAHAGR